MLKRASSSSRFSLSLAGLATALVLTSASPAFAQPAPAAPEAPAVPAGPTPEQIEAGKLFQEGEALVAEGKYEEAIVKYEAAYESFPDVGLQVKIGDAYQRDGTEQSDYDKLRKAVEAYKRYTAKVPEGATTDAINLRINDLEESIALEEKRIQKEKDGAAQRVLDAKKEKEEEEAAAAAKEAKKKQMQIVLAAGLLAGPDLDVTGILRMSGGALLSWEKFAIEGKLGVDGFLRLNSEKGVRGRSFPVLDIGARYGLNYRYIGPFFSGGASFGLFSGKPNERKLKGDEDTCGGGDCSFDVNQSITTRLGVGYGFRATETSTVALKMELQSWFYSVDPEQGSGNISASSVSLPQTGFAVMFGLEFMRWL